MSYAVVRTDKMFGTDNRAGLVSVRYQPEVAGEATPTELENGSVVLLQGLETGEREIYVGVDVKADSDITDVVLIATPEVMRDERKRNLDQFINEAGDPCRGYRFHKGNIFSVTKPALVGKETPEIGDIVELADGTKLNVAATATQGSTKVGEIIDINLVGKYTYFAIEVKVD